MNTPDQEEAESVPHEFASPACLMHEIDPAYSGASSSEITISDIPAWRRTERQRLIGERKALSSVRREEYTRSVATLLGQVAGDVAGKQISMFWPFLGEPDLRGWMAAATARDATCLLPVVVARDKPLIFRSWRAGEPLKRGVWNIPVPTDGKLAVPDIVIAPLVGFDANCFRLGYGGGFFDRTLAHLDRKTLAIGVGFELQGIETIHPLAHDIPMDVIITETGLRYR